MCEKSAYIQSLMYSEKPVEPSYSCALCGSPVYKGVQVGDEQFCEDHSDYREYSIFYMDLGLSLREIIELTHTERRFRDTGFRITFE